MAPGGRPGGGGGGGSSGGGDIDDTSAKNLLDSIGEEVYKEVKNEALKRSNGELKGKLQEAATASGVTGGTDDPCKFKYNELGGAADGKRYPCTNLSGKVEPRFSNTLGGQCTNEKMRSGGKGACAPYRRVHLCHHNLESIETNIYDSDNAKHNLLLEVCMAAYYEGDLIKTRHRGHQLKNKDTSSQLCTVLARSFADIGDIVRGRDLFYGNDEEKKKRDELDKKLKEVFGKIHGGLSEEAKKHYGSDKENYYQLREDWWTANRETVWKAITCDAPHDAQYFRGTCGSGNNARRDPSQCRCDDNQVPTYFDYVPQYLRWFEEWAEDFCRLRKRKLENAIKKCRGGEKGNERYCSGNGFDCEQTIRGNEHFVEGDCHDCSVACSPFVKWLDNQKLEFDKQVKKYKTEIRKYKNGASGSTGGRAKRSVSTTNYDGYEKKFYKELKKKNNYETVDGFLELLNKEDVCTKFSEDEGKINFKEVNSGKNSDGSNKTFSRSKYCKACPWCGVERNGGGWKAKNDNECDPGRGYKGYKETKIPILTGDKTKSDMVKKYNKFCNGNGGNSAPVAAPGTANGGVGGARGGAASGDNSDNATTGYCGTNNSDKVSSLCEKWTCYYKKKEKDGGKDINFCVLQNGKQDTKEHKVTSYNAFFWDWVYRMLHDSLDWRKQLGNCINKDNGNTCKKNNCNDKCECFAKWVEHKQQEWEKIKKHFDEQEDIRQKAFLGSGLSSPDVVLELLLKKDLLLESIKDTHVDANDIERIGEMLQDTGVLGGVGGVAASGSGTGDNSGENKNTSIDKFLQEEAKDATKCQKDCQEPQQSLGRSLNPRVDDDDGLPKKRDRRTNPCSGESGNKQYPVLAGKVAKEMQEAAHENMVDRSVKNGETKSSLEGDISLAEFKNGRSGNELQGNNICDITKEHTNDSRHGTKAYNGPCTGKDGGNERFNAGTKWEGDNFVSATHKNLYIPPRRQHMCTSNLEKLDYSWVIKNTKDHVNDTFLVDVLLAAKEEADYIKNNYKDTNDKEGKCRALRYSFADIGDIIRGRDLWEKDGGSSEMETRLIAIFKKIKDELSGIQGKYERDDKTIPKYKQLREDWWEANRDQVWEAMQCPPKNGTFPCSDKTTPHEDYIPQRLRWMVEWAEWYCKMQKKEYEKLEGKCSKCKVMGQRCTSGDGECTKCKEACDEYSKQIEPWKKQWNEILYKYLMLYLEIQIAAANGGTGKYVGDVGPKDKAVVEFFKELQKQNSGKTTYDTAAGYIHQELPYTQCQIQKHFCTSGKENKDKYVFRSKPNDYDDACDCYKKTASSPEELGRSATDPSPGTHVESEEHDSGDDDDDDDDEEDVEEEEEATKAESEAPAATEGDGSTTTTQQEVQPPPTPEDDNVEKVCATVKSALDDMGSLTNACGLKYGPKAPTSWKCVSSGNNTTTSSGSGESTKSSDSGSICVPPRRRRLYVGKLEQWASDETTKSLSPQGLSTSPTSSESPKGDALLLTAFVESAAIETFFLWHKYKEEKKPPAQEGAAALAQEGSQEVDPEQNKLQQTGEIPNDFLRQMFYTLADYKDIFEGKSIEVGDEKEKQKMQEIQKKIKEILNGDNKKTADGGPPKTDSGTTPQTLWSKYAESIWNGMIYALTYKDGEEGKSPQVDDDVKGQLFENGKNTPKTQYDYNSVKLDNSGTEDPINNPKLSDFVEIPTFFRWLHEWGSDFCDTRKHLLEKIYKDCEVEENGDRGRGELKQKYSGDGYYCDIKDISEKGLFAELDKPSCAKPCSSYRKWIERKKYEFTEQKNAYNQEKKDATTKSGDISDQYFVKNLLNGYSSIDSFLDMLKNGPCKNNNDDDNDNVKDEIDFGDVNGKTFQHTEYCGTCPEFKINCQNGNCGGGTENKCKGKTETVITAKDIKRMGTFTEEVIIRVSDNSATEFKGDLQNDCQHAGIFKGIKENKWECRKVCGVDICTLEKENNNGEESNEHIIVKELLKRWLEYFFEDYNKINKKLNSCMNKGEQSPCIKGCVEKWISTKKEEWQNINSTYQEINENKNDDAGNNLNSFLEQAPFHSEVQKAIKPCDLTHFKKSCGLNGDASSKKSKNGNDNDLVLCLLDKLQKKMDECKRKHDENSVENSDETQTACDDPPPVEDDEEDLLHEEENTVKAPKICDDVLPEPKEPGETCTPTAADSEQNPRQTPPLKPEEAPEPKKPAPTEENSDDSKNEQTPVLKPEEESPAQPAPAPSRPPPPPPHPPLAPAREPFDSTILQTTIPFGVALALGSIAFLFLKVKENIYIYVWDICIYMCFVYMYV
ncbi:hypothetical protein PFTANZ_06002 [Plasmodium falciparum Tanzania (2000708)]|uniref:Duffy-binding-like domain-containing protein n=1 Tax=Plasmodium falciparum Tanzania (2000708) TaxID=1036725 RepID=A0A024VX44_PLAFA|nr:hypothetical protein PFTANZ_06002 [Plasmodium falciparum Tanzania (2000708)]